MAAVYSRSIDDKILRITPSGWTYGKDAGRSLFVLMDKETESLWYPMEKDGISGLVGIGGFYKDRILTEISLLEPETWASWKGKYPDTKYVTE